MTGSDWPRAIAAAPRSEPIGGGATGTVRRVWLPDGQTVVVKSAATGLDVEAAMLGLLRGRSALPVPRVFHAVPGMMVMEDVPGRCGASGAEFHAAELLAALHAVTSPDARFGLELDGTIGPLHQPNAWTQGWVEFFRERRLGEFTRAALAEGALPESLGRRLSGLAARLGELIPDRPPASLIHGDVWSGNVLSAGDRITGFIDPAPYYAHAEVEWSFITLFSTFGPVFFERYWTLRGVDHSERAHWRRTRCAVYNMAPLLVHARLFGGHYLDQIDDALTGLGF